MGDIDYASFPYIIMLFTLCRPMNVSIRLSQDGPLYIFRTLRISFLNTVVFLSLKIDFVLANSADPDEMSCSEAFHLSLHCLQKYLFRSF